jgi:hypothetical protein
VEYKEERSSRGLERRGEMGGGAKKGPDSLSVLLLFSSLVVQYQDE